jgi:hypothetical protein
MTKELRELIQKISKMSPNRAYTDAVREQIEPHPDSNSSLSDIEALHQFWLDRSNTLEQRFTAFYAHALFLQHSFDMEGYANLLHSNAFKYEFNDHPLHDLIQLSFKIIIGTDESWKEDLANAWLNAVQKHVDDSSYTHAFAEFVAILLDQQKQLPANHDYLEDALTAAQRAVNSDPSFAKFHHTFARLLLFNATNSDPETQTDDAMFIKSQEEIYAAINLEPVKNSASAIRVADYRTFRTRIYQEWKMSKFDDDLRETEIASAEKLRETESKLDETQSKSIEIIAFFSGVISFVVGSISIAGSNANFYDKALLIIVMLVALLFAFTGFQILQQKAFNRYQFFVTGASILLLIIALLAHALML